MLRSPFSTQDRQLIQSDSISIEKIMSAPIEDFQRYWRFLINGEDPTGLQQIIDLIASKIEIISREELSKFLEHLLKLQKDMDLPFFHELIELIFPEHYTRIFRGEKRTKEMIEDILLSDNGPQLVKKSWEELRSHPPFLKNIAGLFPHPGIFLPVEQRSFRDPPLGTIPLHLFASLIDSKKVQELTPEPYCSAGSLTTWLSLGDNYKDSKNIIVLRWRIVNIETESEKFHQALNHEWEIHDWDNLLLGTRFHLLDSCDFFSPIHSVFQGLPDNSAEFQQQLHDHFSLPSYSKLSVTLESNLHQLFLDLVEADLYSDDTISTLGWHLEPLAVRYRRILNSYLPSLIKSNEVRSITFQFEILGPIISTTIVKKSSDILDDYSDDDSSEISDLTDDLNHPFIKLHKKKVYYQEYIPSRRIFTFNLEDPSEVLVEQIQKWLEQFTVIMGDKYPLLLDSSLNSQFNDWRRARIEEFEAEDKIKIAWPLITNKDFLTRLDDWGSIGTQLVTDIRQIKDALLTIVSTGRLDLQLIKGLLRDHYGKTGQKEYQREEVLSLWAAHSNAIGDKRKEEYLKNHVLRTRLSTIIDYLKENPDPELLIIKKPAESGRGAPRAFICLRTHEE